MKVNLTSKFRFDLMHWNVSIGPEKWQIFGRFQTFFPLKRLARREKNTSNMAATIGDVMDDVTCRGQRPPPPRDVIRSLLTKKIVHSKFT
jgi:hypothetical protein